MHAPSVGQLLQVWEDAIAAPPARRALALLAAAHPELQEDELLAMPVGRRDGLLLRLREHLFGSRLALVASCPHCGEQLESGVMVSDISAAAAADALDDQGQPCFSVAAAGYSILARLPAAADLLALPAGAGVDRARSILIERCVLQAHDAAGAPVQVDTLPAAALVALADRMAQADPDADLEMAFDCPACRHAWQHAFDITSFLWRELHAWALHTLRDVHQLARAYGWREAEVLALSPARRQMYLELCRQ